MPEKMSYYSRATLKIPFFVLFVGKDLGFLLLLTNITWCVNFLGLLCLLKGIFEMVTFFFFK